MTEFHHFEPGFETPRRTRWRAWADTIESWPVGTHVWGQYAEQIADRVAVCRTENVSACHPDLAALVEGPLREVAAGAFGEPASVLKDKINYKHPGGAGFRPHQDRLGIRAWARAVDPRRHRRVHDGVRVPWLAEGVDEPLPTDDRGVVRDDVVDSRTGRRPSWLPATRSCSTDSHRTTATPTAVIGVGALVASYAQSGEHYSREHYYLRRDTMRRASQEDGRFRISTLADFAGVEAVEDPASDRCTHLAVAEA